MTEDTYWNVDNMLYGKYADEVEKQVYYPAVMQSTNRYAYCMGNPIGWRDDSGLYSLCVDGYHIYAIVESGDTAYDIGMSEVEDPNAYTKMILPDNRTYYNLQVDDKIEITGIYNDQYPAIEIYKLFYEDITQKLIDTVIREFYICRTSSLPDDFKFDKDMSSNPIALNAFYNLVKNGAPLDLKNQGWDNEYYIFDNHLVRHDAPGNIAYGVAGKLFRVSDEVLLRAAGFAQIISGTSDPSFKEYYGDDPVDQFYIKVGISYVQRRKK